MTELKHQGSVLVTGASTGIGRAAALHLDRLGFSVFASVRKESDGRQLCASASDRLKTILLDITDTLAIARASEEISRMHVFSQSWTRCFMGGSEIG